MRTDNETSENYDLEEGDPDGVAPFLAVYENGKGGSRIYAASSRFTATIWGIILADIARLVATGPTTDSRAAAERLIEIRNVFADELDEPTDTITITKMR